MLPLSCLVTALRDQSVMINLLVATSLPEVPNRTLASTSSPYFSSGILERATWGYFHVRSLLRKARRGGEREKCGTTKPKLLTLYVALTTLNSLPAASHLSHVGWFSRSFYYPWGKMGTTRSLRTCLTYLLWQPFVVSSRNAPDRCVMTQHNCEGDYLVCALMTQIVKWS